MEGQPMRVRSLAVVMLTAVGSLLGGGGGAPPAADEEGAA